MVYRLRWLKLHKALTPSPLNYAIHMIVNECCKSTNPHTSSLALRSVGVAVGVNASSTTVCSIATSGAADDVLPLSPSAAEQAKHRLPVATDEAKVDERVEQGIQRQHEDGHRAHIGEEGLVLIIGVASAAHQSTKETAPLTLVLVVGVKLTGQTRNSEHLVKLH